MTKKTVVMMASAILGVLAFSAMPNVTVIADRERAEELPGLLSRPRVSVGNDLDEPIDVLYTASGSSENGWLGTVPAAALETFSIPLRGKAEISARTHATRVNLVIGSFEIDNGTDVVVRVTNDFDVAAVNVACMDRSCM